MLILYEKYDEVFKYITHPRIKLNRYKISNYGNVFSVKHNKIMKPRIDKNGYYRIGLRCSDGSKYLIGVHRLVAWEFCDGYDESKGRTIPNHKDSDPSNNYFLNLEWVTSSENSLYGFTYGNRKARKGELSNLCKYTDKEIHKVCKLLQDGYSRKYVSRITGINLNYLTDIISGKKRKNISSKYNLPKQRVVLFKGFDDDTKNKILKYINSGYKPKEICKKLNIEYNKQHKTAITNLRKKINK